MDAAAPVQRATAARPHRRRSTSALLALLVLVCVVVVSGCGGKSEADKAQAQVCKSVDNIGDELDSLDSISLDSGSKDEIVDSLSAIRSDLQTIEDQLPALASDLRSQVEAANARFRASLNDVISDARESLSLAGARSGLSDALRQLADDYDAAFDTLDC